MPSATPTASPLVVGEPQPQLTLVAIEDYSTPDGDWTRYELAIQNWQEYPAELFEVSSAYPCGLNPAASRTIVSIHDALIDVPIYGFCALSSPDELTGLWFAVPRGADPPASVLVVMTDQLTGDVYRSSVLDLGQ